MTRSKLLRKVSTARDMVASCGSRPIEQAARQPVPCEIAAVFGAARVCAHSRRTLAHGPHGPAPPVIPVAWRRLGSCGGTPANTRRNLMRHAVAVVAVLAAACGV